MDVTSLAVGSTNNRSSDSLLHIMSFESRFGITG